MTRRELSSALPALALSGLLFTAGAGRAVAQTEAPRTPPRLPKENDLVKVLDHPDGSSGRSPMHGGTGSLTICSTT
jgi:hypothetical protein